MNLLKKNLNELNKNYKKIQKDINLKFNNMLKNKIRIAIYSFSLKNGGLPRLTSLILKYFNTINIYELYLFTKMPKESNEYIIPENISRIVISFPRLENLIKQTYENKIDILIYNFYNQTEIKILNSLKNIKIIFIYINVFYIGFMRTFFILNLYTKSIKNLNM